MPNWLGIALFGVFSAVFGYFGRWGINALKVRSAAKKNEVLELYRLLDLLGESRNIFISQNYQARSLTELLKRNHPIDVLSGKGFDEMFYQVYDKFTPEEKELFSLIRSTTMHSMRQINKRLQDWIARNRHFRRDNPQDELCGRLAKELQMLGLHLNQWHDKYDVWIPQSKKRSLVYLADEKEQGVAFPNNLASTVTEIINERY